MTPHPRILAIFVLFLLVPTAARADDQAEAEALAEKLTREATLEYLKDREFEFDDDETIEGTAKAVDPEKHVEVKIEDFELLPGRVTGTFDIKARFEFEGTLTVKEEDFPVEGTADVEQALKIDTKYHYENGNLVLQSQITDAKFEVEVLELDNDDLPGGKDYATKVAKQQLDAKKQEIVDELNKWMAEQSLQH